MGNVAEAIQFTVLSWDLVEKVLVGRDTESCPDQDVCPLMSAIRVIDGELAPEHIRAGHYGAIDKKVK